MNWRYLGPLFLYLILSGIYGYYVPAPLVFPAYPHTPISTDESIFRAIISFILFLLMILWISGYGLIAYIVVIWVNQIERRLKR